MEMAADQVPDHPGVPLAKVIQDLRSELLAAVAEGAGQDLRFKLAPIELELEVGLTWSGELSAGVKFWVVDLGTKGSIERATTQKLKLVLEPVDREGQGGFFVRDSPAGPRNGPRPMRAPAETTDAAVRVSAGRGKAGPSARSPRHEGGRPRLGLRRWLPS
jgi:hypothetical protein